MKRRIIYTVKGSEDGTLGVFTTVKRALIRAAGYFQLNKNPKLVFTLPNPKNPVEIIQSPASLTSVREQLGTRGRITIFDENDGPKVDVTIQEFLLNN